MGGFVERWRSGALDASELDAHYSRVLDEARVSVGRSAALTEDQRVAVASKLGTLKEIVDRGSVGSLIESLAINAGRGAARSRHDDSVAAVAIVDDEHENRRRTEAEARRQDAFATEAVVDAAATITDIGGHVDSDVLPVLEGQEQVPVSESGPQPLAGFAPYERTPIVAPVPPPVPEADPGPGPAMQYPAAAAALDAGVPLDGAELDLARDAKPLPAIVRVPWELVQKGWVRFRRAPIPVQALGAVLVAVLVVVGLFGRGSSPAQEIVDTAGPPSIVNPNGNVPVVDGDLVELQPTGGVGSRCELRGFEAGRAFGKNEGDAWVCRRAHGIDSAFMEIDFGHAVKVCSVDFVPGFWFPHAGGTNEWFLHRLPTLVKILVPAGQPAPEPIRIDAPGPKPVTVKFPNCFTATRISLIVQATQRPENPEQGVGAPGDSDGIDETFALSGLKFMGYDDARR